MSHLDGNALAGPLSEVFEFDATMASVRCTSCGDVSMLAQAMVYLKPHAYIARCSACDAVLMVLLEKAGAREIDLSGITWMSVPV